MVSPVLESIAIGCVALTGLWVCNNLVASLLGGWWSLSRQYRTRAAATGQLVGPGGLMLRFFMRYGTVVQLWVSSEGLHVRALGMCRLFHPPLLIPWHDFADVRRSRVLFWEHMYCVLGRSPDEIEARLPAEVLRTARGYLLKAGVEIEDDPAM